MMSFLVQISMCFPVVYPLSVSTFIVLRLNSFFASKAIGDRVDRAVKVSHQERIKVSRVNQVLKVDSFVI